MLQYNDTIVWETHEMTSGKLCDSHPYRQGPLDHLETGNPPLDRVLTRRFSIYKYHKSTDILWYLVQYKTNTVHVLVNMVTYRSASPLVSRPNDEKIRHSFSINTMTCGHA